MRKVTAWVFDNLFSLAVLLVLSSPILLILWGARTCVKNLGNGKVRSINYEPLAEGGRLVLSIDYYLTKRVEDNFWRFDYAEVLGLDTDSGEELNKAKLYHSLAIVAHTPGTLWSWDPGRARLTEYDFATLRVRREHADRFAERPEFAMTIDDHALVFTSAQGERVRLEAHSETPLPTDLPTKPLPTNDVSERGHPSLSAKVVYRGRILEIDPGTHQLRWTGPRGPISLGKFLRGRLLAQAPFPSPGETPVASGQEDVFIVHRESLAKEAPLRVTSVRPGSGETHWTTPLPDDTEAMAGFLEAGRVLLVNTNKYRRVTVASLQASDGTLRWRVKP
jgi:hypothetical protein